MFHFTARIAVIGHATIAPLRSFHVAPVDGTPGTCPPFRTARFFSMYSYASRLKEESATSCQPSSARSTISTLPTSIERLIRVSLLGQVYSVGRAIEKILDRPHAIEDAPKRIPASAPTSCSQISTSLRRARSRGFYWRARFHELRFASRRRAHHRVVSVARSKPRRAAPGIWVIPSILAPAGHASYHLSHHLNSVIYEGQAGRMAETLTVLQPVFARLGGQGQVCS